MIAQWRKQKLAVWVMVHPPQCHLEFYVETVLEVLFLSVAKWYSEVGKCILPNIVPVNDAMLPYLALIKL